MTKAVRKIPVEIPGDHPFIRFLMRLQPDEACDPFPDIIEQAVHSRYFVGYMGDNASARLNRFINMLKAPADNGASLISQHIGPDQARAVIYLTRFGAVMHRQPPLTTETISDWTSARYSSKETVELDGCSQMPTY